MENERELVIYQYGNDNRTTHHKIRQKQTTNTGNLCIVTANIQMLNKLLSYLIISNFQQNLALYIFPIMIFLLYTSIEIPEISVLFCFFFCRAFACYTRIVKSNEWIVEFWKDTIIEL